jgi:histidine triad (HIT) family protein
MGTLFGAVQRVARAVEAGLDADGTFVAMNNKVSQSVPHLHVHVVPRKKKDGLRGFFWPRVTYADDAEREAFAARIRDALR